MESAAYDEMYRLENEHWWFSGKRRVVLDQIAALPPITKALDLGCGTGRTLMDLAALTAQQPGGEAHGIDMSQQAIDYCRARGLDHVVVGDALALPYADNTFDLVTSLDVFEHLDGDEASMAEAFRVLKPGGTLVATVPAFHFLWTRHDEFLHHKRRYTRALFGDRLRMAGFKLDKLSYYNTLLFPPVALIRAAKKLVPVNQDAELKSDTSEVPPSWLNRPLAGLFGAERHLLNRLDLPVGVSLIARARKP